MARQGGKSATFGADFSALLNYCGKRLYGLMAIMAKCPREKMVSENGRKVASVLDFRQHHEPTPLFPCALVTRW
jgi:hypothetical protein